MVIDENGNFLTGRQLPKMLLIKPKVTKDYLILTADGQKDLKVPIKPPENLLNCRYEIKKSNFNFVVL